MSVSTVIPPRTAPMTPRRDVAFSAKLRSAWMRVRARFGSVGHAAPISVLQPEHLFAYTLEEYE